MAAPTLPLTNRTEQEILNSVFDSATNTLQTSGGGGGVGSATSANQLTEISNLQSIVTNTSTAKMTTDAGNSGSLTAAGSTVAMSTNGAGTAIFEITGTWVGTITFEQSNNGFTTYQSVATVFLGGIAQQASSFTANGFYSVITAGFSQTRVRMSAYTSGTANVLCNASSANRISVALQGNPVNLKTLAHNADGSGNLITSTGSAMDVNIKSQQTSGFDTIATGTLGALNNALTVTMAGETSAGFSLAAGTFAGTIIAEISKDGGVTYPSTVPIASLATGVIQNSLVLTNPNANQVWTILTTGGVTHVRIRVSAYTSGSTTGQIGATANGRFFMDMLGFNGTLFQSLQLDASNYLKTREQYVPLYEDNTIGVAKVEQRFGFFNISTATTTTVKSGAGFLHQLRVLGGTLGNVTVYDNTAGSGTVIIPTFTPAAAGLLIEDVSFSTGLTIVTAAATILAGSSR